MNAEPARRDCVHDSAGSLGGIRCLGAWRFGGDGADSPLRGSERGINRPARRVRFQSDGHSGSARQSVCYADGQLRLFAWLVAGRNSAQAQGDRHDLRSQCRRPQHECRRRRHRGDADRAEPGRERDIDDDDRRRVVRTPCNCAIAPNTQVYATDRIVGA